MLKNHFKNKKEHFLLLASVSEKKPHLLALLSPTVPIAVLMYLWKHRTHHLHLNGRIVLVLQAYTSIHFLLLHITDPFQKTLNSLYLPLEILIVGFSLENIRKPDLKAAILTYSAIFSNIHFNNFLDEFNDCLYFMSQSAN